MRTLSIESVEDNTLNQKIGLLSAVSLTALVVGLSGVAAQAQVPFTAGDLVTYRVGTGAAALTSASTAVFLDEYSNTGTLVQSIAVPTANAGSNFALTASGSAGSEGELNLSADGQYLAFTGYDAAPGVASIVGTASASTPRTIGIVSANGIVDTSTNLNNFSGNNIRAAYYDDTVSSTNTGSNIYAVGANTGVVLTTRGSSGSANTGTVISSTITNERDVTVSNGQLYVSSGSGTAIRIGAVGTGTPTTTGQTTTEIPGGPSLVSSTSPGYVAPYAFFFATLSSASTSPPDTLYFADSANSVIDKYSLSGGTYVASGTITGVSGVQGLTGSVTNGTVNLYATTGGAIYSATDGTGYNGTVSGVATSIVTATTNEAFRGIAFAPQAITSNATPEPGVLPLVAEAGALILGFGLIRRRKA